MSDRDRTTFSASAKAFLVVGALLVFAASVAISFPRIEARFIEASQEEGNSTLRLVSDAVDQAVGRFQPVPGLIAGDPILVDLLTAKDRSGIAPFVNEKLRQTALSVDASQIYVLDRDGTTLASSNYRDVDSFVGKNFSYRPYFQRSLLGEVATFHALGTTSRERGFFFSAPILDGIDVIGVLTVKMTVESIESAWERAPVEIIVADDNGIAFLSGKPEYRLRSLAPLSEGVLERISATRQFPLSAVSPIPFSANLIGENSVEVTLGSVGEEVRYLSASHPLSLPGWHSIVLTPLEPIRNEAIQSVILWNLSAAALVLGILVLIQRRAQVLERVRVAQTQQILLERRVKERTADLDDANESLRSEISVRREAEDRLRKTQKDLVQAGKLAGLGEMSAALSHEINQPLAAVKSYADNARTYIERNRIGDAAQNIERISEMTDRMAKISQSLRNFARQPGDTLKAVPVHATIEEAIAIVDPKLRQSEAVIQFDPVREEVWALGGRLRLQQVLVNVMTNAIDAMANCADKTIELSVISKEDKVEIGIRDHGHGLSDEKIDHVFEAFFTTKEAGAGMGLGLSISYNIVEDFGGKLSAKNHPGGGAVFTIQLRRTAAAAENLVAE